MKMNTDALGLLLSVVPLAMRININIVNVDTSASQRVSLSFIHYPNNYLSINIERPKEVEVPCGRRQLIPPRHKVGGG